MATLRPSLAVASAVLVAAAALVAVHAQTATDRACAIGEPVTSANPWVGADLVHDPAAQPAFIDGPGQDGKPDGRLGPDEPLYLDADGSGTVSVGDIRWSRMPVSPDKAAAVGEPVGAGDPDEGQPLEPLEASFMYADENADGVRNGNEPTVIDVDGDGMLSAGDRWLAPPDRAGDVEGTDVVRVPVPLSLLLGNIAFLDANGTGDRTAGDRPVWDQGGQGTMGPSDLCLSNVPPPAPEASPTPTTRPTAEPTRATETGQSPDRATDTPPRTLTGRTPTSTTQLPGGFLQDGQRIEGRYVAFDADPDEGRIRNFTVAGVTFLTQIQVDCPCRIDAVRDANARPTGLRVETDSAIVVFHDQPQGLIRVIGQGPVRFVPAEGPEASVAADGSTVRIPADGRVAWLQSRAPSNETSAAVADEGPGVAVVGGGVFFVAQPNGLEPLFTRIQAQVEQAILDRRLAAQVQVLAATGVHEPQVLAFEDVEITVDEPQELAYRVRIDAELPEGKAFVFQFPRATLPAKDIQLTYQSEAAPGLLEEVSMSRADSLAALLAATPGGPAQYWIEQTQEGFTVAVTVPHFSIQIFQVLGIPPESAPIFAYGVVLVFLMLGVVSMGMLVGRRGRPAWKPPRREIVPFAPPRPQP